MANPKPNKAAKAAAEFLAGEAGGTTQADVARKYDISRQAVSRAVKRLLRRKASKVPVMVEDAE